MHMSQERHQGQKSTEKRESLTALESPHTQDLGGADRIRILTTIFKPEVAGTKVDTGSTGESMFFSLL